MKSKIIIIALLALSLTGCAKKTIPEEEAMNIAMKDATIERSDVTFTEQKYDRDDNQYTFVFYNNEYRYVYEIKGDGSILGSKKINQTDSSDNTDITTSATNNKTDIGNSSLSQEQQTYLDIALNHFQVKNKEISNVKIEKDTDHGTMLYEVKFYIGTTEYECKIQFDNQNILKSEIDYN